MSKHSIRTGSASSPSARCSPASASTRCWRRRSALSFSWSSASRALRSASSRMRRLPPRSAARISTAPPRRSASSSASTSSSEPSASSCCDDDQRRDRERARVVLEQELLGHDRRLLLALVVEVERLAVREHAVAHLEDLRVGLHPVDVDGDGVERARPLGRDALALEQRRAPPAGGCARAPPARSPARPAAKCIRRSRSRSIWRKRPERKAITPSIPSRYSSLRDVADAGRPAALDVVVEARRARAAAGLGALAGAEQEDLAEQVERAAHALGARVGPEVGALAPVALAREVDAREVLVEADRDVRVGLVVAQPDVEARPVLLDEVLLREQRLGLGVDDERLDVVDAARSSSLRELKCDATRLRIDFALPT